ncbi:MAG TPA: Hsp33 family molecular chaperone HslO, partial [Hyphomicrobiales bacterium]|nr:Hsp33 family molecular chaperone HslO [Hyphomicrobiales bacterium]
LRFSFDELDVRGELVYLDSTWHDIVARYDYPASIRQQLGSALASVALLSATLKFKGTMVLQVHGDGPLRSLVAQMTNAGALRGLARWEGKVPASGPLHKIYGQGHILISVLPEEGERYQSIVELSGTSLADALNRYFEQSEQLPSSFRLSVTDNRVAGFFLQALPASRHHAFSQEQRDEDWSRLNLLADTLQESELLELAPTELLTRLYHEEQVHLYEPKPLHFACSCSRDKVTRTLLTLGRDELEALLREEGTIKVDCEFCNQHYVFYASDVEQIFADNDTVTPGTILH